MPASWKDGDAVDPAEAKAATKAMLEDPRHIKANDSPEDRSTVDDPLPDDEEIGED